MNAATETVKRHKLTQEDCDIARFFTRRGMKIKEIAKILKVDPSTVGKIQKADFRLETYLEQRKEMNRKTKENKRAALQKTLTGPVEWRRKVEEALNDQGWDEVQKKLPELPAEVSGQMQMDFETGESADRSMAPGAFVPRDHLMSDFSKEMNDRKFQAAMVDKLVKVLTEMIVTLDNRLTALDEIRDVLKGGDRDE